MCVSVLTANFTTGISTQTNLLKLLFMIAFAYCVVKIFFQNIKRGGILLVQMAVGSLYMFFVPRGQFGESQYDERGTCNHHSGQSDPKHSKGGKISAKKQIFYKMFKKYLILFRHTDMI